MKVGVVKKAIEEAELSEFDRYRMGAVIFSNGGRILSSGHNCYRTSSIPTKYRRFDHTLHAEQAACLNINWERLKNCSLLVIRITKTGKLAMSFPCKYCMETIKMIGIRTLYYSNRSGEIIRKKL